MKDLIRAKVLRLWPSHSDDMSATARNSTDGFRWLQLSFGNPLREQPPLVELVHYRAEPSFDGIILLVASLFGLSLLVLLELLSLSNISPNLPCLRT